MNAVWLAVTGSPLLCSSPPSSPGVGELTDAATVVQLIDQANHPPFLARAAGEEGGQGGR